MYTYHMNTRSLSLPLLGVLLLSLGSARAATQTRRPALLQEAAAQLSALTGTSVALPEESQAPTAPTGASVQPGKVANSGVVLEGKPSPAAEAALKAAMTRMGSLPSGVELTVMSSPMWGDNPQILIYVDGRNVYWEYLYHSEANLARLRRSLLKPGTWFLPSEPSSDLSKRFEAALTLAREGAEQTRAPRPK